MFDWLDGKKTYIVALSTIIYAGVGLWSGTLDANTAVMMILAALGGAGFRSAMNK